VKNYRIRTHVLIRFFSVAEIPITHYSLYDIFAMRVSLRNENGRFVKPQICSFFEEDISSFFLEESENKNTSRKTKIDI
jgi:hypothetical protein